MAEIAIITLDPSRWQEAKQLFLEALHQSPGTFRSSYEEEATLDDRAWKNRVTANSKQDNSIALYAEYDGKLIGMMGASWSQSIKVQHVASLWGVYVTPSMRGQGIGSQLLEAILAEVGLISQIEVVKLTVTTQSKAAIALYEKFGFVNVGISHKELRVNEHYYDEYLMEKLL